MMGDLDLVVSASQAIQAANSKNEKQKIFDQLVNDLKKLNGGTLENSVQSRLSEISNINGLEFRIDVQENVIDQINEQPDPTSIFAQDVFQLRTTLSKTLFIDVDAEEYSVYVPLDVQRISPVVIDIKPIQTYKPNAIMYKNTAIIPSDNDLVSDQWGADDILYDSHMFNDINMSQIEDFETYLLEKAAEIRDYLPNINHVSQLSKDVNPFNIHNTLCLDFGQREYYNLIADRTNQSFLARRQAVQFDNVVVDGIERTARISLRLHPFDQQMLNIIPLNLIYEQQMVDVIRDYQLVAADGFVATPKTRLDKDVTVIADIRSPVLARLCELSPYLQRTRILDSMTQFSPLWKVNVFSSSIENAKDSIYKMAEISFTVADSVTSALSTVNVASAQQTLIVLLNSCIFRLEIDPTGSQSNFGAAISAAIMLVLFPTDEETMPTNVFDNLCNLVYNELIAWTVDRPTFVKRTGQTNAFEANVNIGGGNMNRDIQAYIRFVLLRRPWMLYQRTYDEAYAADILIPNIDEANVNDQTYVAVNSLFSGLIQAAQRNPNPGRQISANSFRKLLKSMKDVCSNKLMPIVRLIKYNIERMARVYRWFPYSADFANRIPHFRDERLRVKVPTSGVLSIMLGINKAPEAFDWYNILKFADSIRSKNYAEMESIETIMSKAIIRNDIKPSRSKKDYIIQNLKPPTNVVAAISKMPSATLTSILSDRILVNRIRLTQSFSVISRIIEAIRMAFDNVPTAEHGIAKGALLLPYPRPFTRSSAYVRKDNVIYNAPTDIQRFNISDLLEGRFYQGLVGQVQHMAPFVINGPLQVRNLDITAIESVTSGYLTMSSPYDACIRPEDLRHNKIVSPPIVDHYSDSSIQRPNTQFEQLLSKTSVFIIDAPKLTVQQDSSVLTFQYRDIQINTSVVDRLEFTSVKPPDVTLFNGLLVFED
uniref:Inner capsid protein VP2 n=1 Tax=Bovine group B rotavirus TaxID=35334 RepID=D3VZT6_9REOV|nr:VP2 [Bovine group B rotavirus]